MRILFTGGGTGGHLFPIIAVARQLKQIAHAQNLRLEMRFIGPDGFSNEILEKENIEVKIILAAKIRRYLSINNIIDIFKAPIGFLQAGWFVYNWMPDVIFNKGGYGSVPAVLIGWLFRIPILTHESDTIAGLANKLAGPFSKRIAISFAIATKYFPAKKTALTGNPVRPEITRGIKEQAKKFFNIIDQKPILFSIGGSQGAQAINTIILGTAPLLLKKYQIIHICGPNNYNAIKNLGLAEGMLLFGFMDQQQLTNAYAAADLVISRAGSGSIFEIAACAKPSVLIPLPGSASDHQKINAQEYAKAGATTIIYQSNLTPHLFAREIDRLFENQDIMTNMARSARLFSKLDAAQKISQGLFEIAR